MNGGGGYSPGVSELTANNQSYLNDPIQHFNGTYQVQTKPSLQCSGGAYFSEHKYDNAEYASTAGRGEAVGGAIGGQGGCQIYRDIYSGSNRGNGAISFTTTSGINGTASSDGGIAGKGRSN